MKVLAFALAFALTCGTFAQEAVEQSEPRTVRELDGDGRIVFLGDASTEGWKTSGRNAWLRDFATGPFLALNGGVSGDRTENLLWRLEHGLLDGVSPKVLVLMIGADNLSSRSQLEEPPTDTILGVQSVLYWLRGHLPEAKIVLHPILPRAKAVDDPVRKRVDLVNSVLRQLTDGRRVLWCDFNAKLLSEEGALRPDLISEAGDLLEPGYEVWAEALKPYLSFALGETDAAPCAGKAPPTAIGRKGPAAAHPAIKMYWLQNENRKVRPRIREKRAEQCNGASSDYDAIWIGDSITHFWERSEENRAVFREKFGGYRILNVGFGGDKTQNLLWNVLYGGVLDRVSTRLVSLMIGTNNLWADTPEDIAAGIRACVAAIRERQPQATILLHALLPREVAHRRGARDFRRKSGKVDEIMPKTRRVNELIRALAAEPNVRFVDLTDSFTDKEGLPDVTLLGDGTHPNADGYRVWADAVLPIYRQVLGRDARELKPDFRIRLAGTAETEGPEVTSREMSGFQVTNAGNRLFYEWRGHPVCGTNFVVRAQVETLVDGFAYQAFGYDGNSSGRAVAQVVFPEVEVPRTEETRILSPFSLGELRLPVWKTAAPGKIVRSGAMRSFHFIAALNAGGTSYYLDQRDEARFHSSRFEFVQGTEPGTMRMRLVYDVPQTAENARSFALPYGGTFAAFEGGWYQAARRYRDWVETQPHYRAARVRDPGRLREVGLWLWSRGTSAAILPDVERVARDAGVPVALDWYWWHGIPYDTQYPYFWPPREDADTFRAAVRRLKALGVWTQPYVNGTAWDCDDPSWEAQGGADGAVIRKGMPLAREYNKFTHHRLAPMCGEAPAFQEVMAANVRELAASGFDSIYLDQIANVADGTCFNPRHRHAPGGGDHMVRGYRAFVDRLRRENPGVQFSSEDCNEAYLDTFDSAICVFPSHERFGQVAPRSVIVPVATLLFRGCLPMYGSFAMIDGVPPWDDRWPAEERWPAEKELAWEKLYPDQFAVELSRGVTWGLQPMVHNFKASRADDPRFAADYRFMLETARFYHANREFLFDGEMLDPGRMECPVRTVDFLIRKTYTKCGKQKTVTERDVPCAFHSVWRAKDGRIAVVIVNWSRERAACRLSTPDISFDGDVAPRSWNLVLKKGCGD